MSIALLDVNVLVALFDPSHPQHEAAHQWFGRNRKRGWATSSITINGFVRIVSNPAYRSVEATAADAILRLRTLCSSANHHFWPDDLSLLDGAIFRPEAIVDHRQITDVHLLALAIRHGGRLATFDRSIPIRPVVGAKSDSLEIIGGSGGEGLRR
jgi:toxin-antitoxin system PIN domain toxin